MSLTWSFVPDPSEFAALEALIFAEPWLASAFAATPDRRTAALYDDGACVGYCYGQQVLDEVELWRIAVAPERRTQGLGSLLLRAWLETLSAHQVNHVFLEVASRNTPAVGLYLRHGFVEVGRRKAYYTDGDDALLLALDLQGVRGI